MDTRVTPEYDADLIVDTRDTPEYDKCTIFKGLDVVRQCAALFKRRVQSSTRARKAQTVNRQTNPIGRSMIEMLGVLAIIGVLSVGGIAGYSKAIRMWKLNKTFQDLSIIINELMPFSQQLISYDAGTNLLPIIKSLNLTPASFQDYETYLIDYFGNQFIAQTCTSVPCWKFYYKLSQKTDINAKMCYQLVYFAQRFTQNLYRISINGTLLWGNAYCKNKDICLRDKNIQQLHDYCTTYCKENCILEIGFE